MRVTNVNRTAIEIANGQTTSGSISAATLRNAAAVAIQGPAALTGTITVQGTLDGVAWGTIQSGGADVTVGASQIVVLATAPFLGLRVVSSGAEGALRSFPVAIVATGASSNLPS